MIFKLLTEAEQNRTIWPIRDGSVCSAHNDARGLLLPVRGWAEDDQDTASVIKRDKPGSRTSLSLHNPFLTDSFIPGVVPSSQSFTSTTPPPLPLHFHPPFPPQTARLFIKSVIMPLSSHSSPRSQCYWLHYANVNQPTAQSYTADEIRHQHTRARKKKKKSIPLFRIITSTGDNDVDVQEHC